MIKVLLLALALSANAAEKLFTVHVMDGGRPAGSTQGYKAGRTTFVDVAAACRAFGGQATWYQVSSRVYCSLRGSKLAFTGKRSKVVLDDKELGLDAAVEVKGGQAFVPVSFFTSKAFAEVIDRTARFDFAARTLELQKLPNVGALKRKASGSGQLIELELKDKLEHATTKKGRNRLDVSLPGGVVAKEQTLKLEAGPVREARLEQAKDGARLVLILRAPDAAYTVGKRDGPLRLVVEVQGKGGSSSGVAALPTPIDAPPPDVSGTDLPRRRRIVIDPGHGGKDPGTSGRGMKEKDLVLGMSLYLAELLRDSGEFEVLLTRETDVFIPLDRRSTMANEFGADLFVSVHVNNHPSAKENGTEVYFLSEKASNTEAALVAQFENSVLGLQEEQPQDMEAAVILSALEKNELINESALLAGHVAKSVGKQVDIADRGVKQAQFVVLHWTRAPAVLVETGYISNSKDASKLGSKAFRRKMAEAMFNGVLDYARSKSWL